MSRQHKSSLCLAEIGFQVDDSRLKILPNKKRVQHRPPNKKRESPLNPA